MTWTNLKSDLKLLLLPDRLRTIIVLKSFHDTYSLVFRIDPLGLVHVVQIQLRNLVLILRYHISCETKAYWESTPRWLCFVSALFKASNLPSVIAASKIIASSAARLILAVVLAKILWPRDIIGSSSAC